MEFHIQKGLDRMTMREKFTQGEWRVESMGIDGADGVVHNLRFTVLCLLKDGNKAPINGEVMQANASLLKTAPKLYKLLKLACHEFEMVANWCEENGMNDDARSYWNLIFGLQDALAEARGEK